MNCEYVEPEVLVDTMYEIAKAAPDVPFFYYCINFVTGIYCEYKAVWNLL
jgi:hypothetical protein